MANAGHDLQKHYYVTSEGDPAPGYTPLPEGVQYHDQQYHYVPEYSEHYAGNPIQRTESYTFDEVTGMWVPPSSAGADYFPNHEPFTLPPQLDYQGGVTEEETYVNVISRQSTIKKLGTALELYDRFQLGKSNKDELQGVLGFAGKGKKISTKLSLLQDLPLVDMYLLNHRYQRSTKRYAPVCQKYRKHGHTGFCC